MLDLLLALVQLALAKALERARTGHQRIARVNDKLELAAPIRGHANRQVEHVVILLNQRLEGRVIGPGRRRIRLHQGERAHKKFSTVRQGEVG